MHLIAHLFLMGFALTFVFSALFGIRLAWFIPYFLFSTLSRVASHFIIKTVGRLFKRRRKVDLMGMTVAGRR